MHPFAQHVKYYAATLITHPMCVSIPTYGNTATIAANKEARRIKVLEFLARGKKYTSAIAKELGMGPESMLCHLNAMESDRLIGVRKGAKNRCEWWAL